MSEENEILGEPVMNRANKTSNQPSNIKNYSKIEDSLYLLLN